MNWIGRNYARVQGFISNPLRSGPALALGRYVYKNNAGLQQNIFGGIELWNSRHNGPYSNLTLKNVVARTIDEVGYAKAPWQFPRELITKISGHFEHTIKHKAISEHQTNQGATASLSLKDPLSQVPEIKLLLNEQVKEVVYSYFGCHIRVHTPDYYRIFSVDETDLAAREHFSERWHNDSGKVSVLSLLILMSDISEEHGATWCTTRANTRKVFQKGLAYRKHNGAASKLLETDAQSIRFTGKMGDSWFINTRRTLHKAGIPALGTHRDILGLKFTTNAGHTDVWDSVPKPEDKGLSWQRY